MPVLYTDLKDKVVLITGIGQAYQDKDSELWGNGAATAKVFAQSGARIFGCDLNLESATATVRRLEAAVPGVDVTVIAADVTQNADVKTMVNSCTAKYGKIDVLVCNVGKSAPGDPAEMDEKVWHEQLNVNLTSAYQCCHEVLPVMESQRSGSIILMSSVTGLGYVGKSHIGYSTTKAALINFAKVLAANPRYASIGIRTNVVVPGLIHTPLVARLASEYNEGDYEGLVRKRSLAAPLRRMGRGEDVGQAATFLASEEAAGYVNGAALVVDGGLSCVITHDVLAWLFHGMPLYNVSNPT